jgi:phospholipase D1/2
MDSFLTHAKHKLEDLKNETKSIRSNISQNISSAFEGEIHSHTHFGKFCHSLHNTVHNRYHSFAPERTHDNAKYYIDGCAYFYAVSLAIEKAEHEIWIMDWWLSPELYLRRPPMQNEQYRLEYVYPDLCVSRKRFPDIFNRASERSFTWEYNIPYRNLLCSFLTGIS